MEATNMMRKMMAAATVLAMTACGGTGMTGDDGSGGACSSGNDCGESDACDLDAHVCVADALTIDASDFVVQSSMWWTSSSEPTLRGTFEGDATTAIHAKVGETDVVATVDGATWSAKLPAGSIATSNTQVTIALTDAGGRHLEAVRTLGLDAAPPAITLGASPVHDERADAIDFATGEPVHTHAGATIDLASGECPDVYKYAYLLSASRTFGRQTSTNPLAWNVSIADAKLDAESTSYRVRDQDGRVVLDWTSLAKTADDTYTIELLRDGEHGVAVLGTTDAAFMLDVRARDWTGLESVASYCWNNHPLAAPLGFEQTTPSLDLFGLSFAAGSPISSIMTPDIPHIGATQSFVQYTAEPVIIQLAKTPSFPHYSKTYVDDYVQIGTGPGGACDSPDGVQITCDTSAVPDPADATSTGDIGVDHTEGASIVDETLGRDIGGGAGTIVIPARAANEPPHRYRIEWTFGSAIDLRPATNLAVSEQQLLGITYTGRPVVEYLERCTHATTHCPHGVCTSVCDSTIQYARMVALDEVQLDFDPIGWSVHTSASSSIEPQQQTYAAASLFATSPMTWNAGNADLPGPK